MHVDNTHQYRTRSGNAVVIHETVLRNSAGQIVTFPVKGTVIDKANPRKKHMQIWTLDGRANVLGESKDDVVDGFNIDPMLIDAIEAQRLSELDDEPEATAPRM
jgi:hypothetical protein